VVDIEKARQSGNACFELPLASTLAPQVSKLNMNCTRRVKLWKGSLLERHRQIVWKLAFITWCWF